MTIAARLARRLGTWVCLSLLLYPPTAAATSDPTAAPASSAARPRVGLVLSGGGARGFAHVGVIRVLDELGIPIDLIAGTSMGSIVGGLYALGYSSQELVDVITTVDWQEMFRDSPPRGAVAVGEKKRVSRTLMEVGVGGLRLDLPSGLSAGQKVSNLLALLTLPAAGVRDFDQLPIPYRAIAADLVTGKQVVLDGHLLSLGQSMRASMSVPGAFKPVDVGPMLLVDGGLVKNLPVDVVRAMGADIVIAVDVSSPLRSKEQLASVLAVMDQTVSLHMVRSTEEQLALARASGLVVSPDLGSLSSTDFDQAAAFIGRGEEAARASLELRALAERLRPLLRAAPPAGPVPRRATGGVQITGVEFQGPVGARERQLLKQLDVRPGETLRSGELESHMSRVFGGGYAEAVEFELQPGEGDGKTLVIRAPQGPRATLGLGARYDDYYGGLGLVDLTLHQVAGADATLSTELVFGDLVNAQVAYQHYALGGAGPFLSTRAFYRDEPQDIYQDKDRQAQYDRQAGGAELLVGSTFRNWGEVTFGYRWQHVDFSRDVGSEVLPEATDDVASLVLLSRVDTLDRAPFPRTGTRMEAGVERAQQGFGGDVDFSRGVFHFEQWVSPGDRDTVSVQVRVGTAIDSDLPAYEKFRLGGADSLLGYEWGELRGDHFALARADYRRSVWRLPVGLVREAFLRAALSTGNAWESLEDIPKDLDLRYGGSFGVALDTVIGPVTLDFALGDDGRSAVYFFAGHVF